MMEDLLGDMRAGLSSTTGCGCSTNMFQVYWSEAIIRVTFPSGPVSLSYHEPTSHGAIVSGRGDFFFTFQEIFLITL